MTAATTRLKLATLAAVRVPSPIVVLLAFNRIAIRFCDLLKIS
jgi:hypothetical protein